jgi:hypothetical protein
MQSEIKPELTFNFNMDIELTNGSHFDSLRTYIIDKYPNFSKIMAKEDSLYAYIEPKTISFLEKEQEYRDQGYPLTGVRELAFIDICILISSELDLYEINALAELFDLQKTS